MLPGNERSVLEAFRRGDTPVLTQVYRAYSSEVLRYLSRRFSVHSETGMRSVSLTPLDLDAAHQETFVRAFRPHMRQAYDGVRPYLGFLLTVARSTAIDLMRASGRVAREAIPLEDAPELVHAPDDGRSPEEEALSSEVRSLVRRFLDALPAEGRALAQLRFMDGLSQESAADQLKLTRGEVRVRERRLRVQFTEHLKDSGWLDSDVAPGRLELGALLATLALCAIRFGSLP
ncbi:sigma-70 family RNA polymerase sigma factor [Corallococcus praedator]|uniref:Sigma-70 family RNA polymerase sigma factor n=1 Tax=Corallococcus praedator TaxID=2316724 RepID=A0ABX9QHZ1_9BACT|nr:sigma-70 family RNA polymerase sigma factor [Corallococcus sp. CA047B]RKH32345.1 sigma-70 family RNA polymerase sigma factor [Corallococcus sp. CA031C]RKI07736.1 sigma-70 family RNA polymerase sigma factor [Corallococcus praedator]